MPYPDGLKSKNKLVHQRQKTIDNFEDKDTQDNSETVKINHCHLANKTKT